MAQRDLLSASTRANEVVLSLGLKRRIQEGFTRIDPSHVAGISGVPVMYRKLDRLLGGFIREEGAVGILVNSDRPRGLMHMTCAHELGHFFLNHQSTADEKLDHGPSASLVERLADQFAYSLLAPQWLIATAMRERGWTLVSLNSPHTVYQLSLRLGISFTAMVWSLSRLKLIPPQLANKLVMHKPAALKQVALKGGKLEHPKSDVWILGPADKDKILEPGYGDKFVIDLPNHAGSGRLWSASEAQAEGFTLRPLLVDARDLPSPPNPGELVIGSGPSTLTYTLEPPELLRHPAVREEELEPLDARRHQVKLQETKPWVRDEAPSGVWAFQAEFEPTRDGLTVAEREIRVLDARVH